MFQKVKLAGGCGVIKGTRRADGDVGEDPQGDQRCEEGQGAKKGNDRFPQKPNRIMEKWWTRTGGSEG
jgi:hypothetical protein